MMVNARLLKNVLAFVASMGLLLRVEADLYQISNLAGTHSVSGFAGDGGQATAAEFKGPYSASVDTAGNAFISDPLNYRVRMVDSSGIITSVFGTGSSTLAGNNGAATAASGGTTHVQPDTAGNLYVADSTNAVVRRITGGIVYALVGVSINGDDTDGAAATSAALASGMDAVPDSAGNVYVSGAIYKVRKVVVSTGKIYTVAGTGTAPIFDGVGMYGDGGPATSADISLPWNFHVDSVSRLYFSAYMGYAVRRVDLSTGIISFFAGNGFNTYSGDGGPATSAGLYKGSGVASDSVGNVYISGQDGKVRKVDNSGIINRFAGGGSNQGSDIVGNDAKDAKIGGIYSVSVRDNSLFIPDATYSVVYKVSLTPITFAPTFSPSISPSLFPTMTPSSNPSLIPTTAPTTPPSMQPSMAPSTEPSIAPTALPTTLSPTMKPTAPTKKPTALPSVKPTRASVTVSPTVASTVASTVAPTVAPTTHVDITFDASLYLFNSSDSSLTSADASAVTTAVAQTMNVTGGVSVVSSGSVGGGGRRYLTAGGQPYNLLVVVNVQASTGDHMGMNGSALYHHLSGALMTAVESDEFNTALAVAAQTYSAYGLYYVSDVNLTVSAYSVVPAEVVDSNTDKDDDGLSRGDFAGIVIGIVVSFMVLLVCGYYAVGCYRGESWKHDDRQSAV